MAKFLDKLQVTVSPGVNHNGYIMNILVENDEMYVQMFQCISLTCGLFVCNT